MVASYIRLKRSAILAHGLLELDEIRDIIRLELLLNPLMELHLAFEQHEIKLCDVYPSILRAINQYQYISSLHPFSSTIWLYTTVEITVQLYNRFLIDEAG